MNKITKTFDAEVGKVLQLMIHSLYTNKDIFLRELISNASDACDKLIYRSRLENIDAKDLNIEVILDKEKKTITIKDNGIGMSKQDMIDNLGTIARSGTQRFLDDMKKEETTQLIGQFGVGFYSAFMVANRVDVISSNGLESNIWSSDGSSEYSVQDTDLRPRGTDVVLHLREDAENYLDHFKLKHIIKTYSDHISVPIFFCEGDNKNQVNSGSALWCKSKSDITQEEYDEFYKTVGYALDKPWMVMHNRSEGLVSFTNLLFIPTTKTFDLFHPDRKRRVKLYIKKVFIADDTIDLVPEYLRFLRGVVDSEDLPLNISRETLQHNATLEKIKHAITNKILTELKKKLQSDQEDYRNFWNNFGVVLKEGLCDGNADSEKILEISLFRSALHDKLITLDEYLENKGTDAPIYFLSGESVDKIKKSPQIERLLSQNIDVLLLTDSVDDFWLNLHSKYKGHDIKSVTRVEDDKKMLDDDEKVLVDFFKSTLGDLVKDVTISQKLVSSPVCLSVPEGGLDMRMERFLIDQKQLNKSSKKILELNFNHQIIQKLWKDLKEGKSEVMQKNLVFLLFDQACIMEGEPINDTNSFAERMNELVKEAIDA